MHSPAEMYYQTAKEEKYECIYLCGMPCSAVSDDHDHDHDDSNNHGNGNDSNNNSNNNNDTMQCSVVFYCLISVCTVLDNHEREGICNNNKYC